MNMCGRLKLPDDWSELKLAVPWLEIEKLKDEVARYNVAPTTQVWTVNLQPEPEAQRWGLIPSWSKKMGKPLFNARVETVDSKPSFRSSWKKRRCLVPVSGFYEWRTESGKKQPYLFQGERPLLFMAGISSYWKSPAGEGVPSCSVITGPGRGVIAEYHDRMPKILAPDHFQDWLNPEATTGDLHELLQETALTELHVTKVSEYVNNSRHQGAQCSEPVD